MHIIIKRYGKKLEITTIEKESRGVRVYAPRKRDAIYRKRRSDSYIRTKKILVRRVFSALAEYGVPLLVTLTFAGTSSNAYDGSCALRRFFLRLRAAHPECQALFVPELSPRARLHFHGLIFGLPLSWGDRRQGGRIISYGEERQHRKLATYWGRGFVDCRQTDGGERLAGYLAKYFGKAHEELLFAAMRLIRTTKGFPKEEVITDVEDIWNVGCLIEGKKPDWQSDFWTPYQGKIKKTYYTL